jgi:hypothetical protein
VDVPTLRDEVVKVATPETKVPDPIGAPLLRNFTEPEGVVVPLAGLTVATSVTVEFSVILAADETRTVTVLTVDGADGFTVIATMLELEALNATAPE